MLGDVTKEDIQAAKGYTMDNEIYSFFDPIHGKFHQLSIDIRKLRKKNSTIPDWEKYFTPNDSYSHILNTFKSLGFIIQGEQPPHRYKHIISASFYAVSPDGMLTFFLYFSEGYFQDLNNLKKDLPNFALMKNKLESFKVSLNQTAPFIVYNKPTITSNSTQSQQYASNAQNNQQITKSTESNNANSASLAANSTVNSSSAPATKTTANSSVSSSSTTQTTITSYPPILDIVPGSMKFTDATGNNAIDANEKCTIQFQVKNSGKGNAENCEARISTTANGINVSNKALPTIPSGSTISVEVPITTQMATIDGTADFNISVYEPNGFGCDPMTLAIHTNAFKNPLIKVTDYAVNGADNGIIKKRSAFELQMVIQNTEYGKAENVEVSISVPENVVIMGGVLKQNMGEIQGGDTRQIKYEMVVSNNYTASSIPVSVNIKEKYGKYAESKTINLPIGQTIAHRRIEVDAIQEANRSSITLAQIAGKVKLSDVDTISYRNNIINNNTFAVIIANEDYNTVIDVQYAANDGKTFKTYCQQVLGIPEENIRYLENATYGEMVDQIDWLTNLVRYRNNPTSVILYYAGHGIPDESTNEAYLLPVDGKNINVSYKLSKLYSKLAECNPKSAVVLLDACFSGSERSGGMMTAARSVAISAKKEIPKGNIVVLSAAQGDETAYPYKDKQHGLFTYYLLKKLKESRGNVTLGALSDYIKNEVASRSAINGKVQRPTVIISPNCNETWRNMMLNR